MSGPTISVPNWSDLQHYKDRSPPWIKLHRKLLDHRQWHDPSGDAAKLLVELWLVASDSEDGTIAIGTEDLAWKRRREPGPLAKLLVELELHGFVDLSVHDASTMLAVCSPEVEERQSTETEKERETPALPAAPLDPPGSKPKKKPRRVVNYSPEFLEVWAIHPRGGKAEAFDEYVAAVPERIGHEQLVAYLRLYVTTELNEKFRGHDLFRWIKKDRWEEYAIRRPVLSRDDPSTKLRNKAESMAEHLRNLGVA